MNSTERLLACLGGEIPDRVPISTYELVGWHDERWENNEESYRSLMELIRQETDCMYMCHVAVPNAREGEHNVTVEHWDQDDQHFTRTVTHTATGKLTMVKSFCDTIKTIWQTEHPIKNLDDLTAYLALPWEAGEPDFSTLQKAWDDLQGTRGVPMLSVADPICELAEAFEFSDFLVHAITETDAIIAALDQLHERYREKLRRTLTGPVKNTVFRICGAEYATAPYLGPEFFRQFVTRYDAEYIRMIQEAGGFARLHSHGRTAALVDQIAEMGPKALDPLEPPPDGDIDVASLKRAIGENICLIGGIELKHLEHADGGFVEELVRGTMQAGKPNGRFIIMPTSAPINIPLAPKTEENYRRFIETALATGTY